MNNNGQMMIVGILVLVIAAIVFIATVPALSSLADGVRGCSSFNCAGFVDDNSVGAGCSATNQSYHSSLRTDTLGCAMIDLAIPLLIIIVIVGLAAALINGKLGQQEQNYNI